MLKTKIEKKQKQKKDDVCEIFCFNEKKVNVIKKTLPSVTKITKLTEIFKVVGDSTRVKILLALEKGELCVCDISHILDLSLSAVSHQLRLLRNFGLVKYRCEGKMVFYTLDDTHIVKVLKDEIKHIGN